MADTNKSIAIVSAYYPPHMGGVEQYTQNLAAHIAALGCQVHILTCRINDEPEIEHATDGISIYRVPCHNISNRIPLLTATYRSSVAWRTFAEQHVDAYIVNTRFYPLSIAALRLAKAQCARAIVIEHGSAYLTLGNPLLDLALHRYEHHMAARVKRFNPPVYAVSEQSAAWLATFGLDAQGTIPNAIDAAAFRAQASERDYRNEFSLNASAPLVVFTGRLVPEKGAGVFAEAARFFEHHPSGIQFFMAGAGPEFDRLSKTAPSNLTLLGRLSQSDIAALLTQADIFCLPSASEGLPTSLLEAAVCLCYVITTPVGGASEVIGNQTYGTIIDQAIPDDLSAAIEAYLAAPDLHREKAEACCRHVERSFSWDASAQAALHACGLAIR